MYETYTSITKINYLRTINGDCSIFVAILELLELNDSLFESKIPFVPLLFIFLAGTPAIEIPFS